jgi:hypothetical protein
MSLKKLLLIVVIVGVAFYFWHAAPGKDYGQELAVKRSELAMREEALQKVDADIERSRAETEAKICPTTGQPGVFTITDDPRPKVREEIAQLKQEIAELENKMK